MRRDHAGGHRGLVHLHRHQHVDHDGADRVLDDHDGRHDRLGCRRRLERPADDRCDAHRRRPHDHRGRDLRADRFIDRTGRRRHRRRRAPVIVIDGGTISLYASDDGINASASAIVTSGLSITINGGDITIEMGSGDTDAIDSNGDLTITGGTLDITAQSSFDYDGTGTMTGGDITVNGSTVTQLTNSMMGGGGGGGRR